MIIGSGGPNRPVQRGASAVQHRVYAYDVCNVRRARRIRRVLSALQVRMQYSVFEVRLTGHEHRDLLAELAGLCQLDEDRLASWAPRRAQHVRVDPAGLHPEQGCGGPVVGATAGDVLASGNAVLCYDVRCPVRLRRVAASVAPHSVPVQRSVHWLRMGAAPMTSLLERLRRACSGEDSLCAYPLAHASDLWLLAPSPSGVLPCAGRSFVG